MNPIFRKGYALPRFTEVLPVGMFSIIFLLFNMESALNSEAALMSWMSAHFSVTFTILGLYFILPVFAAIACALGRDFRYPLMGRRLAKYLYYDSTNDWLDESHEDRWVAAAGHFSVIIALWGLLAPVTAWIQQGGRSAWLKFQSAQAIALHASVLLLGFAAGIFYAFGFVVFIALTGFSGNMATNSSRGLIGLLVMFGSMTIALLILLVVPLFHIMGQWAGYRVLKGDDYRYPVIGKLVARFVLSGAESATKNLLSNERDPSVAKSAPSG